MIFLKLYLLLHLFGAHLILKYFWAVYSIQTLKSVSLGQTECLTQSDEAIITTKVAD